MNDLEQTAATEGPDDRSFITKLVSGRYGLALTYWAFYFIGLGVFFVLASQAVDSRQWLRYLAIIIVMGAYTMALVAGIRATYKGPQLWKVISRTSSVFMIINILVGICTLGFVY